MKPLCHWKQWALIALTTSILMVGRLAAGEDTGPSEASEEELRVLMQQMEAYQVQNAPVTVPYAVDAVPYAVEDAGPQHPTPKERSLEADLAAMQHRAVVAEEALATCRSEVATLRRER